MNTRNEPSIDQGGGSGFDVDIAIDFDRGLPPQPAPLDSKPNRVVHDRSVIQAGERHLTAAHSPNETATEVVATSTKALGEDVVSEIVGEVRVSQIIVGNPSPEVEPTVTGTEFRSVPFRPDTVIDGWSNAFMTVRGASLRGHYHRYSGAPRQDDFAVHLLPDGRLLALVADGVSAAPQSHLGSSTAVQYAAKWLHVNAAPDTKDTDWMGMVKSTAWALTEQAQAMMKLDGPDPGIAEQLLATTLVCAVIESSEAGVLRAFIVGIGDSGAWVLRNNEFLPVLGGKVDGEDGISSSAVAGLPRVPNELQPAMVELGAGDVLLLGTDGIGDPLGPGHGGVGNLFRQLFGADEPPSLLDFARAMDFSRVTFDDDRTLIAVIPKVGAESE